MAGMDFRVKFYRVANWLDGLYDIVDERSGCSSFHHSLPWLEKSILLFGYKAFYRIQTSAPSPAALPLARQAVSR